MAGLRIQVEVPVEEAVARQGAELSEQTQQCQRAEMAGQTIMQVPLEGLEAVLLPRVGTGVLRFFTVRLAAGVVGPMAQSEPQVALVVMARSGIRLMDQVRVVAEVGILTILMLVESGVQGVYMVAGAGGQASFVCTQGARPAGCLCLAA